MKSNFKRPFKNFVKKAHKPLQLVINDEVDYVCGHPYEGEPKVGDLAGFFVRKFTFNRQLYLMAYRPPPEDQAIEDVEIEFLVIDFYRVGVHENFYDELKHYIKEE
jgi:hypothetical protein